MTTRGVTLFADTGFLSPGWADTGADHLLDDRAWLAAMVEVELALARAQVKVGIVPPDVPDAIAATVDMTQFDWEGLVSGVRATGNPAVVFVSQLTKIVAATDQRAADYVHRGSTSQDILDTATMLVTRRVLDRVHADLSRVASALAGLAGTYRDTVMAGRTLTQHAVPITFGLKASGWLNSVMDVLDRLDRLALPVSLGGAAGTLAAYQEFTDGDCLDLVEPFADELGLTAPLVPWHSARLPIVDIGTTLAAVTGVLGKIAADVEVLTRTEIGELAEPQAPGRGASSAMPQKRNPVYVTAILTAARQVPQLVAVLHQSMVVPDERSAGGWHAEWQPLRECLRLAAGAARNAADLTNGLCVFPERMLTNLALTGGAVVSERLSAVLTPLLGKSEAKALLTEAAFASADRPAELPEILTKLLVSRGHEVPDVAELCDPSAYLGASGQLVDRVLQRYEEVNVR
ncbi:3-carboxy-cis,cis-muconate cycloisomerase [Lentzea sp. BCCO 10_0856]|uniref:3-carboxy-cis,cis-muconate cycloisomerase n=1 Tax=Lentzea miocenica TaxID=3095431 RepID=A0ABU4TFE2_9PSEU|nr:3-carboxy-cis,cis-muconate cycloisomerase [Lentzea sp. BCCO 10_0856]MDX8036744.1 3-carboxy-cis,cis-muconate cycloisomerase [Lentzea sp. BCCO 10_0856]